MRESTAWVIIISISLIAISIGGLKQCSYEHEYRIKKLEMDLKK